MMELIPQRVELIHPMLVHFPLALLLTGALARVLLLVFERFRFRNELSAIFLWSWALGFVGSVAAYLSGEEAEGVVNRLICDPTLTHDHADFALATLWLAGIALVVAIGRFFLVRRALKSNRESRPFGSTPVGFVLLAAELLLVAAAVGALTWTGHLGGKLIYEQGAGYLRTPNEACDEALAPNNGAGENTEAEDDE